MTSERKIIHDIRNCLNSMKLSCSCLGLFSPDEAIESMDSIIASATHLEALIEQFDALHAGENDTAADHPELSSGI